jgi:hypothetical protein
MTQTSIEWLIEQMQNNIHHTIKIPNEYVEQAKEMHRQEIMNAVRVVLPYGPSFTEAEQYYNNTFKKD